MFVNKEDANPCYIFLTNSAVTLNIITLSKATRSASICVILYDDDLAENSHDL